MVAPVAPTRCRQPFLVSDVLWGAERKFWQLDGVYSTAVGYSGGSVKDPSYREVCNGDTMHAEVVLVVFDPAKISFEKLLQVFWESHDPTQGMRQGNDFGTQYRSAIYFMNAEQHSAALATLRHISETTDRSRIR
ncbi:peptide methionine sulfoxide reductase Msr [Acidimicrobiaceae bacterium]|nr:peptide methionine sulfoxide reductase Msr [Acidimicrobiaceae bacterium]